MAVKKTPSNNPLKGSISLSSSCRYSLFASTTPARKAPRAGLRPTCVINTAMPITIRRELAVKTSRNLVFATTRSKGRISNLPATIIPAITPRIIRAFNQPAFP